MTFDVDVERITSKERQYDQFLRIMNDNKLLDDKRLPSEKFKVKDVKAEEVFVEKVTGQMAKVAYLPTSEMPNKEIFGAIDPLEGSPTRETSKRYLNSGLIGDMSNDVKELMGKNGDY